MSILSLKISKTSKSEAFWVSLWVVSYGGLSNHHIWFSVSFQDPLGTLEHGVWTSWLRIAQPPSNVLLWRIQTTEKYLWAREQLQHRSLISRCSPASDYFSGMEYFGKPWNHPAVKDKQAQSPAVDSLMSLVPTHQTCQSACSPPTFSAGLGWGWSWGWGGGGVRAPAIGLSGTSSQAIAVWAHAHGGKNRQAHSKGCLFLNLPFAAKC